MKIQKLAAISILFFPYALTGCSIFDEGNPSFASHTKKDIYAVIPSKGILNRVSELKPGSRLDVYLNDKSVVIMEFYSAHDVGINGKVVNSDKLGDVYYYQVNPTELTEISYSKILLVKTYSIPPRAMPSELQAEASRNKIRKKISRLGPGLAPFVVFLFGGVASL